MRRRWIGLLAVAVVAVAGFLGVRGFLSEVDGAAGSGCSFGAYDTSTDQAATASTMVGVVVRRKLPRRAAVLVLAAALQESKLRNIPARQGDRDSVGVLQQRPSQGWGSAAQLADVGFATGAFLDRLVSVPRWRTDPLATVVQAVQISADGSLYAQHEAEARELAGTFTGGSVRGLTCHFPAPDVVAPATVVAAAVQEDLGVVRPAVSGPTITAAGAGWATAAWFVANADRLGIDSVSYGADRWSRAAGWQNKASTAGAVVAVMAG